MDVQGRRRGHEVPQGRGRQVRRRAVLRPAGCDAALQRPGRVGRRGLLHRRPDVRRLVDPGLPGDPRVGHEADPRRDDRLHRPVPHGQDAEHQLQHRRPADRRALQPRPAPGGGQGRGVPEVDRHRRHRVLRPRGGVLHLRRRALRDEAERRLLLHRLHRGRLEHRPRRGGRQPRPQDALQGRLLPGPAGRPLRRPARRDLRRARQARPAGRAQRTTRSAPPARRRSTTASTALAQVGATR